MINCEFISMICARTLSHAVWGLAFALDVKPVTTDCNSAHSFH